MNRLSSAVGNDPARTLSSYLYNNDGLRDRMKDVSGHATIYGYDGPLHRLTRTTFPDGTFEQYGYNNDSELISRTDRMSRATAFAYDADGRLLSKTYPDNSSVVYTWNDSGLMRTAVVKDPAGLEVNSLSYEYHPTGRLLRVTSRVNNLTRMIRYDYHDDGRLKQMVDETANKTVSYGYYDNGWLNTVTDQNNGVFSFSYNNDGSLSGKTYPSGVVTTYQYTNRGRLLQVRHATSSGTELSRHTFRDTAGNEAYNAVGNRTAMSMRSSGTVSTHTWDYDESDRDRLLAATHTDSGNPNEAYWYDPEGNRKPSSGNTTWVYDPLNNELDANPTGVTYTYDANGNRATRTVGTTTSTYTYDYENRLIRVVKPGSSTVSFEYDALGRRVKKTVGSTVTLFWYDGDNVLVETNGSGTEQARYTHGPGIDNVLKARRGSTNYYYHEDGLGSVVLITNSSQTATRWYRYDSWGRIVGQSGSSPANTFTYTGREWDSELGLYYYRARHYDPTVGRFLQEDPVEPPATDTNLYPYVGGNPVNWVDPRGLMSLRWRTGGGWYGGGWNFGFDLDLTTGKLTMTSGFGTGYGFGTSVTVVSGSPSCGVSTTINVSGGNGVVGVVGTWGMTMAGDEVLKGGLGWGVGLGGSWTTNKTTCLLNCDQP
jgi:RHS repeat-associated protein